MRAKIEGANIFMCDCLGCHTKTYLHSRIANIKFYSARLARKYLKWLSYSYLKWALKVKLV